MTKKFFQALLGLSVVLFTASYAAAHCEIPCGIYDDEMRFNMMAEHITTIDKSIKQIIELETGKPIKYNQQIRWVMNKEHHADEMASIVTKYFLQQRLKLDDPKWAAKVKPCHEILFYSMKAKQTTDPANVEKLRAAVEALKTAYFTKKEAQHLQESHSDSHAR